ncbi:MAG TPA: relaxase/mobilization nuclease domain-containing protein [Hyphomicrobiaceae bacterium]|nr:relaxase/mobilization nuclease domain-containing protein [Hyphomicrobiaceae bacterium]
MAWLAANAMSVRQAAVAAAARAAGMSYADYVRETNPFRGNKGRKPVYTLSIAWHPEKNRMPTRAQMIQAAEEVLGVLGFKDHQAVIVQHTDTKHPHLHLIVNRVHPTTGLYAKTGNDWLKLSRWALEHEKKTGLILCWERFENWKKRDAARELKAERRKTDPKAKGEWILARDVPRRDHDWFRSVAHLPAPEIRQARAARQEHEREQFRRIETSRNATINREIVRFYGPERRALDLEIRSLMGAEASRERRFAHPIALLLSPRDAFKAVVELITARAYARPRRIRALQKAERDLQAAIQQRKTVENRRHVQAWDRLLVRQDAERRRDDERIAALARAARGKGTADRGRQVFNLRGNVETARYVSPRQPLVRLSDVHARVSRTAEAGRTAARNALAKVVRLLGGNATTEDLRKRTIGGRAPPVMPDGNRVSIVVPGNQIEKITPDRLPVSKADHRDDDRRQNDRRAPGRRVPVTEAERVAFEARRDAALERIEADNEERRRRKRVRPRGRSRKME